VICPTNIDLEARVEAGGDFSELLDKFFWGNKSHELIDLFLARVPPGPDDVKGDEYGTDRIDEPEAGIGKRGKESNSSDAIAKCIVEMVEGQSGHGRVFGASRSVVTDNEQADFDEHDHKHGPEAGNILQIMQIGLWLKELGSGFFENFEASHSHKRGANEHPYGFDAGCAGRVERGRALHTIGVVLRKG